MREEEPIARHLPLRACSGTFERWVHANDEAELVALVRAARAEKLTIRPIPPFSDSLPPEGGLTGMALRLGRGFEFVRAGEDGLDVGAASPLALLGLREGFGAFRRAPGTLSDALEDGWIAGAIVRVRRFKGRGFEEISDAAPDAKALVVSAVLRPDVKLFPPKAGVAFREPKRRGVSLRELLGRIGAVRLHGAALAEDDPAVLLNRGEATPRDLRLLMAAVRERVHTATGVELEERLLAPGRGGRL